MEWRGAAEASRAVFFGAQCEVSLASSTRKTSWFRSAAQDAAVPAIDLARRIRSVEAVELCVRSMHDIERQVITPDCTIDVTQACCIDDDGYDQD